LQHVICPVVIGPSHGGLGTRAPTRRAANSSNPDPKRPNAAERASTCPVGRKGGHAFAAANHDVARGFHLGEDFALALPG